MGIATQEVPTTIWVQDQLTSNQASRYTHNRDSFSPAQAHSQDRGSCLPGSQVDGISSPISHPSPECPRLVLALDWVHVLVRPDMVGSKSRLLLWQFPCLSRSAAVHELLLRWDVTHLGDVLHDGDVVPRFVVNGGRFLPYTWGDNLVVEVE